MNGFIKLLVLATLGVWFFFGCAGHPAGKGLDQTVESVDLGQYMGRWYAIASFPVWFQKDCHCITAEYTMQKDYVAVINTCRKDSSHGLLKVTTGKAFVLPGTGDAQLKVQFFWPFKGDYWIIALDEGYEYAMVGHPRKKYLWILSRAPSMADATYAALIDTAREKGYDVSRLVRIPQDCD